MYKILLYQRALFSLVLLVTGFSAIAQTERRIRSAAEEAYDKGDLETSLEGFDLLLDKSSSPELAYNKANTLYRMGKYEEAAKYYKSAAESWDDQNRQADAWYNLGNAYFNNGNYDAGIHAYKEALRRNPDDNQARHNLLTARIKQKEQQKQEEDQSQSGDSPEQNQDQQDQDNNEQKPEDEDTDQKPPQEQDLPESVDQLLRIMEDEERKVQQKLQKQLERPNKSTKRY